MSETIAVALITGVVTGAFGLSGSALAYRSASRTAAIELEKIRAENERLREQRREEKRDRRQGAYQELLHVGTKLYRMFGAAVEVAAREELVEEYNWLIAGILLYAPDDVRDRAYDLNDIVRDATTDLAAQDSALSDAERWKEASEPHEQRIADAINALVEVMRDDVVRPTASG